MKRYWKSAECFPKKGLTAGGMQTLQQTRRYAMTRGSQRPARGSDTRRKPVTLFHGSDIAFRFFSASDDKTRRATKILPKTETSSRGIANFESHGRILFDTLSFSKNEPRIGIQ